MGEYTSGGEIKKASIHNEKEVTVDDVVSEADLIWKIVRSRKVKKDEEDDKLLEEMRKAHPDFALSYPIVLRYLCQFRSYNSKAFKQYLLHIKNNPWKSQSEYLDSQTDYVVILYKKLHPRWNKTQIQNLWKNIRMQLQNEDETFKKYLKEFETEVESESSRLEKDSRDELFNYFKSISSANMTADIVAPIVESLAEPIVEVASETGNEVLSDVAMNSMGNLMS